MTYHKHRLKCTVSAVASSGLGAFTVSTADSGKQGFAAADDGLPFDCTIEEGSTWEEREGCVYTHSGTSLSRGTLKDGSSGPSTPVAFTTAAKIIGGPAASTARLLELAMAGVRPGGRLTLTTAVPVTTADVTGATSIYYTPYVTNIIPLWDGARWKPIEFTEYTLALGTLSSGKPYDVFAYISSGVLALESLAWTNDTTRATAVSIQDGRYCKSGDKTRLYLGTFYTTATTTTEDSKVKRYLWNAYNQAPKQMEFNSNDAGHTWTGGSGFRAYNNSSANKVEFVCGLTAELQMFAAAVLARSAGTASFVQISWALDTTSSPDSSVIPETSTSTSVFRALGGGITQATAGYHAVQLLERLVNSADTLSASFGQLLGDIEC